MKIKLFLEDFATYDKTQIVIEGIIAKFEEFLLSESPNLNRTGERILSDKILEDLIVNLVRSSSQMSILNRSDERATRSSERKKLLPIVSGKSTSLQTQYKFQLIEYLIYGNDSIFRGQKTFISEYQAYDFVSSLILILQLDNSYNYEILNSSLDSIKDAKKDIHEKLRTDYKKSYVPGTLEGFPKGVRINSALGSSPLIHKKQ